MGITPVFGVSEADRDAPYTRDREVVVLGPARADRSYLAVDRVVQAAVQSRCTAVHPGWGFLAENPVFAALCETHGISFIGPPAHAMHLMGKKIPAKKAASAAGLRLIPGSDGVLADAADAKRVADEVGYPVLLKAEGGGGGRGMRVAQSAAEIAQAFEEATGEARAAFGDPRVYLEKLVEQGRHIEIQILADKYGAAVHIGERDCTVQRNHQKLIEESPAPVLSDEEREATFAASVRAARQIGYVGAGTMEFLLDGENTLRFMEMNTRLQVEHTVSEERSGLDLVEKQILIAAGHPLGLRQEDIPLSGHAIECRINAEDPFEGFRPAPGQITRWDAPSGEGIRVDTHVATGYQVSPHYDSLLCKVITAAPDRAAACERMIGALEALKCDGVPTTVPMHVAILRSEAFASNQYDSGSIPGWPPKAE